MFRLIGITFAIAAVVFVSTSSASAAGWRRGRCYRSVPAAAAPQATDTTAAPESVAKAPTVRRSFSYEPSSPTYRAPSRYRRGYSVSPFDLGWPERMLQAKGLRY